MRSLPDKLSTRAFALPFMLTWVVIIVAGGAHGSLTNLAHPANFIACLFVASLIASFSLRLFGGTDQKHEAKKMILTLVILALVVYALFALLLLVPGNAFTF